VLRSADQPRLWTPCGIPVFVFVLWLFVLDARHREAIRRRLAKTLHGGLPPARISCRRPHCVIPPSGRGCDWTGVSLSLRIVVAIREQPGIRAGCLPLAPGGGRRASAPWLPLAAASAGMYLLDELFSFQRPSPSRSFQAGGVEVFCPHLKAGERTFAKCFLRIFSNSFLRPSFGYSPPLATRPAAPRTRSASSPNKKRRRQLPCEMA